MAQTLVFNPFTGNFDAESVVTIGTVGSSSSANGATIDPIVQALTLTPADGTNPGLLTAVAQTIAGQKTFTTGLTGTLTGSASLNLLLTGGTMSGVINMGSNNISNLLDPTTSQQAATKNYVDLQVAGLYQDSVKAATTANIPATYNNGTSGVGATLTITATGALVIDGYTTLLNDRVLIKNQTSGFQDGIYVVTTAGTTGVSAVLTRATDYNTASEMNGAGMIPVIGGTTNATTSWQQVNTIVTVGTDPLSFTEFTANPSLYLLKSNNLSDVSSTTTAFNNISPITSTGDLIIGTGANTSGRLGIGSNGYLLTSNGTTASWSALTLTPSELPTITLTGAVTGSGSGGSVVTSYATSLPITLGGTGQTAYTTGDTLYASATNTLSRLPIGSTGTVLTVAGGVPSWVAPTTGTVNSVSVASANGFSGTSSGGANPALTLSTSISGLLKGSSGALAAATSSDLPVITLTGAVTGSAAGGSIATAYTTVPTTSGGTGLTSVGTAGQLLTSNGTALSYQFLSQIDKNYLSAIQTSNGVNNGNGNFELGSTAGWSLGTVGTLTNGVPTGTPTFGSGAAGTLAISTISSGQLSGSYSLSYASSAATTAGNMLASNAFYIDTEDQAKVLTFKMYYQVPTGASTANFSGTSSNSFGIAIYDVTNSSWLSSTANFGMTQNSGTGYVTGTMQTNSTTTQLRFVMYNANATTGAVTLYLDDISVGPQTVPIGAPGSDFVAYTPTFTGIGTPGNTSMFWRRVGDSIEIIGTFTTGTVSSSTFSFTLPNNLQVSTTKLGSSNVQVGSGQRTVSGTTGNNIIHLASSTSGNLIYASLSGVSSANSAVAQTGSTLFLSSEVETVNLRVPIQGWSSNVQMSSDTDTRVIAANVYLNTTTAYSHPIIFNTVVYDTAGAYSASTGIYTVPVSGYYKIYGTATSSGTPGITVYKNGTALSVAGAVQVAGNPSAFAASTLCVAGDQLSVGNASSTSWTGAALGSNNTSVTFERLSGPSVIAATESVNMRYYSSSTTVSSTLATVVYSNKGWDTHNAYNATTGIYTAPVSGKYQVNASIAMTGTFVLNSTLDLQVQQSGSNTQTSESKAFSGGAVTQMNTNVGDIFYMLAGDQLKVQVSNSGTAPVIAATTTQNWISLSRVGN